MRLLLAAGLTLSLLPYAWGYVWKWGLVVGTLDRKSAIQLAAGVVAIGVLSFRPTGTSLAHALRRPAFWLVLILWLVAQGVVAMRLAGPLLPAAIVVPACWASGLWLLWLAWMFHWPMRWPFRLGTLLMLAILAVGGWNVLEDRGLSGSGRMNLVWRGFHWPIRPAPRPDTAPIETARGALHSDHDYPQFLGPDRTGMLAESKLSRDWTATPPRLMWRQPVGAGWGGFAVAGDYAFTQEQLGADECVCCYEVASGKRIWRHADATGFSSTGGPGPRATPSVDGQRVYSLGATGRLNCLHARSGQAIWSVDILADNRGGNLEHGISSSPLVVDERVLVSPTGNPHISLAAYDKTTGKRLWQAGNAPASYSSPMLATLAGVRQVLLFHAKGLAAHDIASGRLLWDFPWTNSESVNCSQPLPHAGGPDGVFLSTGYNQGCVLLKVARAADARWEVHPLWQNRVLRSKFSSCVVCGDAILGLDEGVLVSLDVARGARRARGGRYQYGQILLSGTLLLVQAEHGDVVLVDAAANPPCELGRIPALSGKTWNHPALAGHRLLVRNDQEAACYALP